MIEDAQRNVTSKEIMQNPFLKIELLARNGNGVYLVKIEDKVKLTYVAKVFVKRSHQKVNYLQVTQGCEILKKANAACCRVQREKWSPRDR